jgi:hypothetical protein
VSDHDDVSPPRLTGVMRNLMRGVLVCLGLMLVVRGFEGSWDAADLVADGLLLAAIVLGVVLVGLAALYFYRRGRDLPPS